ncbi:MAG: DUF4446 family protein [Armatimonadota bacterium]|nr:DUF4446 family protein [Armatimonadota bacterium]
MFAGRDVVMLVLVVLVAALAVVVAILAARVRTLARMVAAGGGDPRILDRLSAAERGLATTTSRLEHLAGRLDRLQEQTARCLQRVGLVRYDALQDLGGHLSFSLALLDARQDGIVVSVLNGRDGARGYAKPIANGGSTFTLSEEEQRAISQA